MANEREFSEASIPLPRRDAAPELLHRVSAMIHGIRYGSVEIVVHDGNVVQIERREKIRWPTEALKVNK